MIFKRRKIDQEFQDVQFCAVYVNKLVPIPLFRIINFVRIF